MPLLDLIGNSEIVVHAVDEIVRVASTPRGAAAYMCGAVGATLVVISAFTKTMIPLRWLVAGSNLGFVLFAILHPSMITLLLNVAMLPINVYRAVEMQRLTRRVAEATKEGDLSGVWLRPYMKTKKLRQGAVLFHKGDEADKLYMLVDGEIELVEIGVRMDPGRIFGEIAFFAPDRRRTQTARCVTPCTVLSIDEETVRQLYFQNPGFGFHMIGLVAARLVADVHRLEDRLEQSRGERSDAGATPA